MKDKKREPQEYCSSNGSWTGFFLAGFFFVVLCAARLGWASSDLDEVLSGFEDSNSGTDTKEKMDWESGFDDDQEAPADDENERLASSWWQLSGALQMAASFNVAHEPPSSRQADYRELTRYRPKLDLEMEVQLPAGWKFLASGQGFYDFAYAIKGRSQFTEEVLEAYEYEAELTDTYIQGSLLPRLDLKLGRQIVVWGKSDNLRITDVLNPLDNREPGLVDIEDLRLPVAMVRVDYYFGRTGNWSITALVIPELRFGKEPVYGGDFFPFNDSPFSQYFEYAVEKRPTQKPGNYEYALAVSGLFSGWDLSLYGARFFEDQYHPIIDFLEGPAGFFIELQHSELYMAGAAMNAAFGNWLLKTEIAYLEGFAYAGVKDKKSRLDFLLGLEYTGLKDTTLSLEAANRHFFAFEASMGVSPNYGQEDSFQGTFRVTRLLLHEILEITLVASMLGEKGQDGAFERFSAKYDMTDALEMTGGFILYQHGDNIFFTNIEDKDRIFLEFKYSF